MDDYMVMNGKDVVYFSTVQDARHYARDTGGLVWDRNKLVVLYDYTD